MVRLSSANLVLVEGQDEMTKPSISSGMYDLDNYSDEQRNFSSKISMQETFDDTIATDEGSVVDAKNNPTQLYLRLHYRLWDMVVNTLKSKPQEASVWIVQNNGENKVLPLHMACKSTLCPPEVLEALMMSYPKGLHCGTAKDGSLPLHIICDNEYFIGQHGNLIMKMIDMSPKTLQMHNLRDEMPTDVLKQHLCSNETRCVRECQQLLTRMDQKLSQMGRQATQQATMRATPRSAQKIGMIAQMNRQPIDQATPSATNKVDQKSSILQRPSTDAPDDGFANRLNRMRMGMMTEDVVDDKSEDKPKDKPKDKPEDRPEDKPEDVSFTYNSPPDERLRQAHPLQGDDDDHRDYVSPSFSRKRAEDVQFREHLVFFDQSSSDEDFARASPRSVSQAKLKLTKTLKENYLLRKQLSQLTEKYTSVHSNHENQCTLIDDLKRSVDQEREVSKSHVKDYELRLARTEDQLLEAQRQLENKARTESNLAQRISQLESSVAGKKADLFTVKAALRQEDLDKATMEEELEELRSDNETLKSENTSRIREQELLVSQLEDTSKELETYKEIDAATKKNLKELDATFQQKEIQIRSLAESITAGEKKAAKLEKFNAALKTKATDLTEVLKSNTETFKATIVKLESELQKKEKAERETLEQVKELQHVFEVKDKQLESLTTERRRLESTCETLKKKEVVAEQVSTKLASVSLEYSELQATLRTRTEEIERLTGEVKGLITESALKSGTIDESDRRMEALYTELVAQRARETDLEKKNKDMAQRIQDLTRDHQSKSTKLKILKNAVESYKVEMEQFVVEKSGSDSQAAENVKKLLQAEEHMGMERVKMEELRVKLLSAESREQEARSMLNKQELQIQEFVTKLQKQGADLENCRRQKSILEEKSEQVELLRKQQLDLTEKMIAKEKECNDLKTLCDQKTKAEEDCQIKCTNMKDQAEHQDALVEDLELTLSKLKSEHTALHKECEVSQELAAKQEDLRNASAETHQKAIDAASLRIHELVASITELNEEKFQGTKRASELEIEVSDLRELHSNALSRVSELENDKKERLAEHATLCDKYERSLSELKARYTAVCEAHEAMEAEAEKRAGLNRVNAEEQRKAHSLSSTRISELHAYIAELKEEKSHRTKRIDELEVVVNDLRQWYSNALSRVSELENVEKERQVSASSDTSAVEASQKEITRIHRVATKMKEAAARSNDTVKAQSETNNLLKEENSMLKNEGVAAKQTIEKLRSSNCDLQEENKTLRVKMKRNEDTGMAAIESLTSNNLENLLQINVLFDEKERLEASVANMESTLRQVRETCDDLRGELATNVDEIADIERQRIVQVRAYEDKIALLDGTIAQLRTTLEEQHEVVTLKLAMSSEMVEERAMLKKAVDALTVDSQRSQSKCEMLQSQLLQVEKEKSALLSKMHALDSLTGDFQRSQGKCEVFQSQLIQVEKEKGSLLAKTEALDALTSDFRRSQDHYEKLQDQLAQVEKEKSDLLAKTEALHSLTRDFERSQDKCEMLQAQLVQVGKEKGDLFAKTEALDSLVGDLQRSHGKCEMLQSQLVQIEKEKDDLLKKTQVLGDLTTDLQRSQDECETLHSQLLQVEKEKTDLIAKTEALDSLVSQNKCEMLQSQLVQVEKEKIDLIAKTEALDLLTKDFQGSQDKCERLQAQLVLVEREKGDLLAKIQSVEKAASVNYEVDRQDDQNKMMEKIDSLSHSLRTSVGRSEELEKCAEELKALRSQKSDCEQTIASLETSITEHQKELSLRSEEAKRNEELSKSYQIEVGRLLKVNTALREECQEINFKTEKQSVNIEELRKCKEEYEKQSVASSMKLLDILNKFSPEKLASDLIQEKEELQRQYEKMSEDNLANAANVEYLVTNIQLLETRVVELTSTHKLLLDETEGLRNTITDQSERIVELEDDQRKRIVELEDGIRLNTQSDSSVKDADAESSSVTLAASIEWDKQIIDLVSKYTDEFADKESLLKKAANRSAMRETLRLRVNEAFQNQSSKITNLHDHVNESETRAAQFEKSLKDVRVANQTLKLENKILKTAGKERDLRSNKTQAKLKQENESLKQAIEKLTQQTADHQLKIRRLAVKQASLQRKKEAARYNDKTKALETMKLANSEDMGSLAFSADSQDAGDSTAPPSMGRGDGDLDSNVEVVLVEDSLESRDDSTKS